MNKNIELHLLERKIDLLRQELKEQKELTDSLVGKLGFDVVEIGETEAGSKIFEFVKNDEEKELGDYLNPITYKPTMKVESGKWYTDGDDIWEAYNTGYPSGFDDTRYFDIITV